MARLIKRINPKITYTIIDLPSMSVIQYLYLSSILTKNKVNLIIESDAEIKSGCINLVPLSYVNIAPEKCDMFVSTFALNESSPGAVNYVLHDRKLFGAKHFLLAYQGSGPLLPHSTLLGDRLVKFTNGKKIRIPFRVDTCYYIFK